MTFNAWEPQGIRAAGPVAPVHDHFVFRQKAPHEKRSRADAHRAGDSGHRHRPTRACSAACQGLGRRWRSRARGHAAHAGRAAGHQRYRLRGPGAVVGVGTITRARRLRASDRGGRACSVSAPV